MESVYFYCAALGGGLLVLQVLLLLLGGADTDVEVDVSPEADVGEVDPSRVLFQLSLKTVVAFVTFFGLAGMATTKAGWSTGSSVAVAVSAGAIAFWMVGYVMQTLQSLQSKGNLDLRAAIGQSAKVELRIPANHGGTGKVAVIVGSRLVSRKAITKGDAIPTGAEVVIDGMSAPDTFEVTPQR